MVTLDSLKQALRDAATTAAQQPLSDEAYLSGFETLTRDRGWEVYETFIIPRLSRLLTQVSNSGSQICVLEIGPGPRTILEELPRHIRQRIWKYEAYEPNELIASRLEQRLCTESVRDIFPCVGDRVHIYRAPFTHAVRIKDESSRGAFNLILFCHSLYGMKEKSLIVQRALTLLDPIGKAVVAIFHRDGNLNLKGLIAQEVETFPSAVVQIQDNVDVLDHFASFIAGYHSPTSSTKWRETCRSLGETQGEHPGHLFGAPNKMLVLTSSATALSSLTAQVPLVPKERWLKSSTARRHQPAGIVKPRDIEDVQRCVNWALQHGLRLTILAGGHSGHCQYPATVCVDMSTFDGVSIVRTDDPNVESSAPSGHLVVVGAGCTTGDVVRGLMEAGLTVPMGSRPSVGLGICLQGGIGHLARRYGLACDAIVGATLVSVDSGQLICIGEVQKTYRPPNAVQPEDEEDLLWAVRGAGTNFGIVTSLTLRAYAAPKYLVHKWTFKPVDDHESRTTLVRLNDIVNKLPDESSADIYLYWNGGRFHVGITLFETSTLANQEWQRTHERFVELLGDEESLNLADGCEVFDAELYISGMHGGHGGGKTSSFKRCVFFDDIGDAAAQLVAAIQAPPTNLCYFHLLHGGGAIDEMTADATAFGCRDWTFACVITAVWARTENDFESARAAEQWVYSVTSALAPVTRGVYGADLGPDPRDAALVKRAFGPNLSRLSRLKRQRDPHDVLAYTCPLKKPQTTPKLIVLVTGEHGAGKDYCAEAWVAVFTGRNIKARVISISDVTKMQYAVQAGADIHPLLTDRSYKEQHRPALTEFYCTQLKQRPSLPEEHFCSVVSDAHDIDVLLITGMRDKAPMAIFSPLVPRSRLLDVRVSASPDADPSTACKDDHRSAMTENISDLAGAEYCPHLTFNNTTSGPDMAIRFAERHLLWYMADDIQHLADMVQTVPDFPRQGIQFRDVLNIVQRDGGLSLCTSLLKSIYDGDWASVEAVASCEAGGYIFGSALAVRVNVRIALIRQSGKRPPPVASVEKSPSHISSTPRQREKQKLEISQGIIRAGMRIVVVDDVLATGQTLCAILQLLCQTGVKHEDITAIVVAEFPVHRGRELLRTHGFGRVKVHSVIVLDGR